MVTATLEAPNLDASGLSLVFDINPEGEAQPFIPVKWSITEALATRIVEAGYTNPHIVITVTSVKQYGDSFRSFNYETQRVYSKELTETPMLYVQFNRAGENIVSAYVVDFDVTRTKRLVTEAIRNPNDLHLPSALRDTYERQATADLSPNIGTRLRDIEASKKRKSGKKRRHDDEDDFDEYFFRHDDFSYITAAMQRVLVPKEHFAKEPPELLKRLVRMFFHDNKGVDECDFRRRILLSLALSIPVQLYGLFPRLFTLLYGVFMAKRHMPFRQLFALNPHDFGRSLKLTKSFWLSKPDGEDRDVWWEWITPPALAVYTFVLFGAYSLISLFGVIWLLIQRWLFGRDIKHVSFLDMFLNGLIPAAIVAAIIAIIWLTAGSGRDYTEDAFYWVKDKVAKNTTARELPQARAVEAARLAEQLQAVAHRDLDTVGHTTIVLAFNRAKSMVCKPFAK
ncbi:MAG TPA: hypothetical protein VN081_04215 [Dongiaceae bacterium]|nr:hypothetical protein [Dongiaceae bacterium]